MQVQGMKKELEDLKKDLIPNFRSINVLLQTKANDMTNSEIDKIIQKVPVNQIPTDVLEAVLNRDLSEINNFLGTDYRHVSEIPSTDLKKWLEHLDRSENN